MAKSINGYYGYLQEKKKGWVGWIQSVFCNENKLSSSIHDNIFLSTMCLLQCLRKRKQKTFKKYELLPKGHPDMTAGNKSVISIHRLEANS